MLKFRPRAQQAVAVLAGGALLWAMQGAALAQTRGGTLSLIAQPEPPLLVNAINPHVAAQYVGGKIYQSLLTYSPELKPQPVLARSWTVSPDGLLYTFNLQPNVSWHDGKKFTAADVVFNLNRFAPDLNFRWRTLHGRYIASIKEVDPLKVEVRLKEPFPSLLALLGSGLLPIVPKHIYEGTDYRANPANQTPIGTGPFIFKEWKHGAYIKLLRNPNYWKKGLPYLDEIVFHVLPDASSRSAAFEKGDVQLLRSGDADFADVKRLRALPEVKYSTAGWELYSGVAFLEWNLRRPPFDNPKVRQAVLYALNRKFIVDHIFFGFGKVSTGAFISTLPFYDPAVPQYAFDLKKAKALIKESGVDVGKTPVQLLNGEKGGVWERLAEYTKQALEPLGFKVSVVTTDAAGWYQRVANWDFDLSYNFLFQYGDPEVSVAPLYQAEGIVKGSPFNNVMGYNNPATDALWNQAARLTEHGERQKIYSKLQDTLARDLPVANIFEMVNPTLYRSNVRNVLKTATSVNESLEDAYLEAGPAR